MEKSHIGVLAALMVTFAALPAMAQVDRTPNLGATFPGSWFRDRYAPCQVDLATVHGRTNVAQIGVCAKDSQANRPSPRNDDFHNTQGMKFFIDPVNTAPPLSQVFQLDLFVETSWSDLNNGLVEPEMWPRFDLVSSDAESTAWYPILGFTNGSGTGEFRYFNTFLGWQDLSAPVHYGAWNSFSIEHTGNVFIASVNGTAEYTEHTDPATLRLSRVFLESYNQAGVPYTADWSQHEVVSTPEPASLALVATGLVGLGAGALKRRRSRKSSV